MFTKVSLLCSVAAAVKSKCPFGFTSGNRPGSETLVEVKENVQFPSQVLTCPTNKVLVTKSLSKETYTTIAEAIISDMHASTDKVKYAACLLRLEGHDLMDFRRTLRKQGKGKFGRGGKKLYGGADGCVNFDDGDNAGLAPCLAWTKINSIYQQYCHQVSLADFMVIAGEVVVGALSDDSKSYDDSHSMMSRFREQFMFGRETLETCPENVHLMPNPENGCDDLKEIFIDHIYNTGKIGFKPRWHMTAALSGAHTIGSAKVENSGYDGMWGDPANQAIFNNDYYKNVITKGWGPKRAVQGNSGKNQWQLIDDSPQEEIDGQMMLNTDMCLFFQDNHLHAACMKEEHDGKVRNRKFCRKFERKGGFINAKTSTCCAWTQQSVLLARGIIYNQTNGNENFCGEPLDEFNQIQKAKKHTLESLDRREEFRHICCKHEMQGSMGDCDSFNWPKGPAMHAFLDYSKNVENFYHGYLHAWKVATENGWDAQNGWELHPLE